MPAFIQGSAATVGEVLSGGVVYHIPGYQRPYAWPKELALQLLDDIVTAHQRGGKRSASGNYYLGNIVLAGVLGAPSATVVDGQQRLITLTILLALLRDRGAPRAVDAVLNQGAPRVSPRKQDADFFDDYIQQPGATQLPLRVALPTEADDTTDIDNAETEDDRADDGAVDAPRDTTELLGDDADADVPLEMLDAGDEDEDDPPPRQSRPVRDSRRAIFDNREAMSQRLDALFGPAKLGASELANFILDRCHLIRVHVADNTEAHRVFVVMHTRGLDLTRVDVLKSEVLGSIPIGRDATECQEIWEHWEERLGRVEFEALFAHMRSLKTRQQARKDVFVEVREAFKTDERPAEFVKNDLLPAAKSYEQILEGTCRGPATADPAHLADLNRRLVRLSILPYVGWTPVAMRLLEVCAADTAGLAECVRRLDKLAFGLFIVDRREERIKRFMTILTVLHTAVWPRDSGSVLAALTLDAGDTQGFFNRLTEGAMSLSPRQRNVVLRRLDSEQIAAIGPLPDYQDTNAEHVLPRKSHARPGWKKRFPEPKGYVQNFGNLIILPSQGNERLGNLEFEDKKTGIKTANVEIDGYQFYSDTGRFGLLPDVIAATDWTPHVVTTRRERFVEQLLKLWDLPRPPPSAPRPASTPPKAPPPKPGKKKKAKAKASLVASPATPTRPKKRKKKTAPSG